MYVDGVCVCLWVVCMYMVGCVHVCICGCEVCVCMCMWYMCAAWGELACMSYVWMGCGCMCEVCVYVCVWGVVYLCGGYACVVCGMDVMCGAVHVRMCAWCVCPRPTQSREGHFVDVTEDTGREAGFWRKGLSIS